jgi:hypothetical protein
MLALQLCHVCLRLLDKPAKGTVVTVALIVALIGTTMNHLSG